MSVGANGSTIARGRYRYALSALAIGLLSACGGDDASPTPTPTPTPTPPPSANRGPTFSSAATASVVENSAGGIYQAAAGDPDGDTLTYSIAGGVDSARFSITPTGQLAFAAPPNFDLATDADADNVYELRISVSDGKVATDLALAISVTNSREGVAVRRIATGFIDPVAIAPVSDTVMLVAEKTGAVYALNPRTGTSTLLVQIANVGGVGVTAIAASPTFASDGIFYAMYTTATGFLVVNRYLRNPAGPTVPDNFGPLLAVNAPQYAGGGWLGYDAEGALLAATGDAGGAGDPTGSAQDSASRLGKIIRITANPDPYAGASPSFFIFSVVAKGLHQPNGGSRFPEGVLIADHGQDLMEEIDFLEAGDGVRNFAWPSKEGTRTVRGTPPPDALDPVIEYPRGIGPREGEAIVGGAPGPIAVASLRDQYVFADRGGAIFAVSSASIRQGTTLAASAIERRDADFVPDLGTIDRPAAITAGPAGKLFILDADGEIFRIDAD